MIEHVRSQTGESLGAQLNKAHREIEGARLTWEGGPAQFRSWARSTMLTALIAMGSYLLCETPDYLIGTKDMITADELSAMLEADRERDAERPQERREAE